MITVEFFRPDGREAHAATSFPWVRVAGDTLLAEPSGDKIACYSGGVWTDANDTAAPASASKLVVHGSTCTIRFEDDSPDDSTTLGPFERVEFLGGAVYGQPGRRLLARLDEQSKAWYAYENKRAWAGMAVEKCPSEAASARTAETSRLTLFCKPHQAGTGTARTASNFSRAAGSTGFVR
jgi:hypothetical protein